MERTNSTFSQGVVLAIIAFVGSLIGSGLVTYYGSYLQNSLARRQELVNALADYYSAAASEYYAQADLNRANASNVSKSSNYYIELMRKMTYITETSWRPQVAWVWMWHPTFETKC